MAALENHEPENEGPDGVSYQGGVRNITSPITQMDARIGQWIKDHEAGNQPKSQPNSEK